MNGRDFRNTPDEAVKIYIPGSLSAACSGIQKKPMPEEKDDVRIYNRSEKHTH